MIRERPNWDEFFMFSAFWTATRSSCLNLQTGAVIVKDKRIISSGYNGAPPRIRSSYELNECRKEREGVNFEEKGKGVCRGNHAEANALSQIARQDLKGTTMYTVYYPCSVCAKTIVGSELEEVVYSKLYSEPDALTKELFEEAGLKLRKLEINYSKVSKMIKHIINPLS